MLSPTGQVFSTWVATGRRWRRGEAVCGVFEGCGSPAGECAGGELLVASRPLDRYGEPRDAQRRVSSS